MGMITCNCNFRDWAEQIKRAFENLGRLHRLKMADRTIVVQGAIEMRTQ